MQTLCQVRENKKRKVVSLRPSDFLLFSRFSQKSHARVATMAYLSDLSRSSSDSLALDAPPQGPPSTTGAVYPYLRIGALYPLPSNANPALNAFLSNHPPPPAARWVRPRLGLVSPPQARLIRAVLIELRWPWLLIDLIIRMLVWQPQLY